jgi:hypothetical protein
VGLTSSSLRKKSKIIPTTLRVPKKMMIFGIIEAE